MVITFLTPRLPPSVCGVGDHTVSLASALRNEAAPIMAIQLQPIEREEQLRVDVGLHESSRVTALNLNADPQQLAQAWESPVLVGNDKLMRAERDVVAALHPLGDKINAFI